MAMPEIQRSTNRARMFVFLVLAAAIVVLVISLYAIIFGVGDAHSVH